MNSIARALLGSILVRGESRYGANAVALADDVQRNALPYLAVSIAVGQQSEVAVRVHVDEPWANYQAVGVYRLLRVSAIERTDAGNPAILDANVRVVPGISGSVYDLAAEYYNVVFSHILCHPHAFVTSYRSRPYTRSGVTSTTTASC